MRFIKKLWRWFWGPTARFAWGAIILTGFVGGILFWGSFHTAMEATNTLEFCVSCHEMDQWFIRNIRNHRTTKTHPGYGPVAQIATFPTPGGQKLFAKFRRLANYGRNSQARSTRPKNSKRTAGKWRTVFGIRCWQQTAANAETAILMTRWISTNRPAEHRKKCWKALKRAKPVSNATRASRIKNPSIRMKTNMMTERSRSDLFHELGL